jgi:hypothetical protein
MRAVAALRLDAQPAVPSRIESESSVCHGSRRADDSGDESSRPRAGMTAIYCRREQLLVEWWASMRERSQPARALRWRRPPAWPAFYLHGFH